MPYSPETLENALDAMEELRLVINPNPILVASIDPNDPNSLRALYKHVHYPVVAKMLLTAQENAAARRTEQSETIRTELEAFFARNTGALTDLASLDTINQISTSDDVAAGVFDVQRILSRRIRAINDTKKTTTLRAAERTIGEIFSIFDTFANRLEHYINDPVQRNGVPSIYKAHVNSDNQKTLDKAVAAVQLEITQARDRLRQQLDQIIRHAPAEALIHIEMELERGTKQLDILNQVVDSILKRYEAIVPTLNSIKRASEAQKASLLAERQQKIAELRHAFNTALREFKTNFNFSVEAITERITKGFDDQNAEFTAKFQELFNQDHYRKRLENILKQQQQDLASGMAAVQAYARRNDAIKELTLQCQQETSDQLKADDKEVWREARAQVRQDAEQHTQSEEQYSKDRRRAAAKLFLGKDPNDVTDLELDRTADDLAKREDVTYLNGVNVKKTADGGHIITIPKKNIPAIYTEVAEIMKIHNMEGSSVNVMLPVAAESKSLGTRLSELAGAAITPSNGLPLSSTRDTPPRGALFSLGSRHFLPNPHSIPGVLTDYVWQWRRTKGHDPVALSDALINAGVMQGEASRAAPDAESAASLRQLGVDQADIQAPITRPVGKTR